FIDHELVFVFDNKASISKISESDLTSNGYSLGIYMRCGVKTASSIAGLKSDLTISDDFFAGIKSSDKVITMNRTQSYTVTFTPTVPFGCYGVVGVEQTGKCDHKVHMIILEEDQCVLDDTNTGGRNPVAYHDEKHALCGFEVQGCYPANNANVPVPCEETMQTYDMTLTTQSFGNDYTSFYSFRLETQNAGTHKIWKNYMVEQIDINIQDDIDARDKICYSHVDPHMQTTKGKGYENNDDEGEFILYWNIVYDIQVQERTTLCDHFGRAFCTCAVAIRSGGDIFLINLCNDLKFIGMTSCKDNSLVIQKYSELEYQVQTNIGTLVKIRIRPYEERHGLIFDELMNIDIVMAPKDYESIRGLCGLFDLNHDFHDRNGNPIGYQNRKQFVEEWKLRDSDKNYLTTTCKADVKTWEEDNQRLFCYCNCYDTSCDTVKNEAMCSPSQYLNCTVSREATMTLCNEFTDRCITENRKRRSALTFDHEKEMQRKASLSHHKKQIREKRQIEYSISIENSTIMCTEGITGTASVQKYSDLFGGYNYSSFIQECIIDVYNSQSTRWISAHKTAAKDAVQIGFKINSNYTLTHNDELVDFKIQYCPSNCSGNGYCSEEGVCKCEAGYFGTDCGNDKTEAPGIDDVEGGGFCDTRYGSECRCFELQTRELAEDFHCKRVHKKVLRNGTVQDLGTDVVSGAFKNMFMGECCFETRRRTRSSETTDDIIYYLYDASISNDGIHFGATSTVYIYDSTCLNTRPDGNGNVTFEVKSNTCIIKGLCYEDDNADIDNACLKCKAATDQFNWTYSCADSDNEKHMDRDINTIAISVPLSLVGGVLLVFIGYLTVKKLNSHCALCPQRQDLRMQW
ncbi:von Willebrand factor D and EGF domain-containing protein-like, partial [Mercenaria mercenaria]|uniref:von Willebrand factor D and EGF domain-containing protein-like n=1 Tax=Mercenaria mercenaria TaxID=6596 RepID=UPI00234F4193